MLRVPAYYKSFACTADRCADSCCIGWQIDVDDAAAARYRAVPGAFGERLGASLLGQPLHFAQQPDGRCAFLDKTGLCDIYRQLGAGALCAICAAHPRFYNEMPGVCEAGLGLCCEEAARLILTAPDPAALVCIPAAGEPFSPGQSDFAAPEDDLRSAELLLAVRQAAFSLVQNRALSLQTRLALLVVLADEGQTLLDADGDGAAFVADWVDPGSLAALARAAAPEICAKKAAGRRLLQAGLRFLADLPPLCPGWPARLKALADKLDSMPTPTGAPAPGYEDFIERVLLYYLYRWVPQALPDGEAARRLLFALAAALFTGLLARERSVQTGSFSLADGIDAAKTFSQEVEYAPGLPAELAQSMIAAGDFSAWLAAAAL